MYEELTHYGVKGMKWGIRRYQNKDGSLTAAGKKRYSDAPNRKTNSKLSTALKSKVTDIDGIAGMDEVTAFAIQAVSMVAILGISRAVTKKAFVSSKMKELEALHKTSEFKSLSDVPKQRPKTSNTESAKITNPGYPTDGRVMNCTFCTTAMVLRERGYDVRARATPSPWPGDQLFKKAFNSETVKLSKAKTGADVINALSQNGPNAYGNLTVQWKYGGGHSIFWKNSGGKTHIYDAQSGKEIDVSDPKNSQFLKSIAVSKTAYNRLDNAEPTEYALSLVEKVS